MDTNWKLQLINFSSIVAIWSENTKTMVYEIWSCESVYLFPVSSLPPLNKMWTFSPVLSRLSANLVNSSYPWTWYSFTIFEHVEEINLLLLKFENFRDKTCENRKKGTASFTFRKKKTIKSNAFVISLTIIYSYSQLNTRVHFCVNLSILTQQNFKSQS